MDSGTVDDVLARELAAEQAHSDAAHARLDQLRADAARSLADTERARPSNHQAVFERDVFAHQAATRRAELDAADDGLVFGRLDHSDGSTLHIGRIGVRTADLDPLVVDWRAPAAAAFYRATAVDPLDVARRRTITSAGRRVTGINDELLDPSAPLGDTTVVGEGSFLAALARERGSHMRDIAATIAREQDEVIRAPDDGAVLVTGGPGTGKTAVALHRVAYLMYAHRDRYARRGVLVVGPSGVFIRYISQVLPTLGETSATLASLGELVPGVNAAEQDPPGVAAVKGDPAMAELLRRAVRQLGSGRPPRPLLLSWRGHEVHLGPEPVSRRLHQLRGSGRTHNALRRAAASALADLVWQQWVRTAGAQDWRADTRAALRDELSWTLAEHDGFRSTLDAAWPVLRPREAFDSLRAQPGLLERSARGLLSEQQVQVLLDAWAGLDLTAGDDDDPARADVTVADVALLDELDELLGELPSGDPYGAPEEPVEEDDDHVAEVTTFADRTGRRARAGFDEGHRGYAHVVVDEAQDVSPMQWRMLARRGRGASWTVVGDWAQSAWPDVRQVRTALESAAGRRGVRTYELATNYRTTGSVAELAARVLRRVDATAAAPVAVRDRGDEVDVRVSADPLADLSAVVAELAAAGPGSIGVIAPHGLVAQARSRLGELEDRVAVVDPWQAKGLEYDGCVVVAPETLVRESVAGLRALYVALTRATRRLVVVTALPDPWGSLLA